MEMKFYTKPKQVWNTNSALQHFHDTQKISLTGGVTN